MNDVRKEILNSLSSFGEGLNTTHISELNANLDFEKRILRSDLLHFDYSKQRINDEA